MPVSDNTLWFNPRCSKCREALELLKGRSIEPTLRLYLEQSPTVAELETLCAQLGEVPIRKSEPEYAVLGLSDQTPRAELIAALVNHPTLLERPIFVRGSRAVVGRPPARVFELLQ